MLQVPYGYREANQAFELLITELLGETGFVTGKWSPCIHFHPERQLLAYVHGDDFVVLGLPDDSAWLAAQLSKRLIIKDRGLLSPPSAGSLTEIRILNRLVRWVVDPSGGDSIEWEADPRHVQVLKMQLGFKANTKGVNTPGEKN